MYHVRGIGEEGFGGDSLEELYSFWRELLSHQRFILLSDLLRVHLVHLQWGVQDPHVQLHQDFLHLILTFVIQCHHDTFPHTSHNTISHLRLSN